MDRIEMEAVLLEVSEGTRRVVDVRDEAEYLEEHTEGAVCIPLEELAGRLYELPDTSVPLLVVHSNAQDVDALIATLHKAKWTATPCIFPPPLPLATGANRNRLYKPSPALELFIDKVEKDIDVKHAFDLGCGHGRDMAFLAGRGWAVTGVDNRSILLDHATDLCGRVSGVAPEVLNVDLKKQPFPFEPASCEFVVVVRFLLRELLEPLRACVKPGGFLLYSHFLEGCHLVGPMTPKTESHYLKRGELEALFSADEGFEVVESRESLLPDQRPIVDFLARRVH